MKYKIQYKKNIPNGFIGMNKKAARSHHIPFNHNGNVIEIKNGLSKRVRLHTISHEKAELWMQKYLHYPYKKAHNLALRFEKLNKPLHSGKEHEELKMCGILKR